MQSTSTSQHVTGMFQLIMSPEIILHMKSHITRLASKILQIVGGGVIAMGATALLDSVRVGTSLPAHFTSVWVNALMHGNMALQSVAVLELLLAYGAEE